MACLFVTEPLDPSLLSGCGQLERHESAWEPRQLPFFHSQLPPSWMSTTKRKWDEPENGNNKSAADAAAAAAAIAAKIAAQFANGQLGEGAFSTDIDINDVRNRYMLTKGSTQQQVLLILYRQY